jgi:hypothetical protein
MARKAAGRTVDAVAKERYRCFLCLKPIAVEEQARAYERVREDTVPSGVEYAHGECAQREGLWDEDDEEEDAPRKR